MFGNSTLRRAVLTCAVAVPFLAMVGCGGSLVPPEVSAMAKVASGQMNTLTGAEIEAVATTYLPDLPLTAEQADAIAQFLADNNVATITDLEALLQKAITDPTSIKLPDGFLALFENMVLPTTQP